MTYQYNHIEVFNLDDEELLSSENPFRIALYAAKKAVLCKNEEKQKLIYLSAGADAAPVYEGIYRQGTQRRSALHRAHY